jgi:hypothetical protein
MERRCYAREPGTFPALMCFAGSGSRKWGMRKVSEYRQHARECRSLAKTARFSQHREILLNMAAAWETLANDRIKTAEGLERIAKLENAARKSRKRS